MTDWLNLSEAAEILGVHPGTLRNWSNQGQISVHLTQGGHRRYLRSELEQWLQSQHVESPDEVRLVSQNALRSTRYQISEGRLSQEAWYNKLDEEARTQYRQSGRTLLQGLMKFIDSDEKAISEAETIGYEYASRARRYNLSYVDAARAFLFFRDTLVESVIKVYGEANVPAKRATEMYTKIHTFTDDILISLLETYRKLETANH